MDRLPDRVLAALNDVPGALYAWWYDPVFQAQVLELEGQCEVIAQVLDDMTCQPYSHEDYPRSEEVADRYVRLMVTRYVLASRVSQQAHARGVTVQVLDG